MTMQHQIHPDDERLAALAGGDPDVVADADLRAHLDTCQSCREVVDEITNLRTALAELPDLVPSRRLQLIPPVVEPRAAAGGSWLRRLAAPVMAAGFGLVLVGAIGSSGILSASSAGPLGGAASEVTGQDNLGAATTDSESAPTYRSMVSPMVVDSSAEGLSGQGSATPPRTSDEEAPRDSKSEAAVPGAGTQSDTQRNLFVPSDPRLPWLIVLGFGVGLLIAGLYLRFSAQPRAG
jgi:hypothetical protein